MSSPKKTISPLCPLRYYGTFHHTHLYILWDVFLPTFHIEDHYYHAYIQQLLENQPHLKGIITASDINATLQIAYFAHHFHLSHVAYFDKPLTRREKKQCKKYEIETCILTNKKALIPIAKLAARKRKYHFVSHQNAEKEALQILREELLTASIPIQTFAFLSADIQMYRKYRSILHNNSFQILSFLPLKQEKKSYLFHPLFSSSFSMMLRQIEKAAQNKEQEENIVLWLKPPITKCKINMKKKKMPLFGHYIASILWKMNHKAFAIRIAYHQFLTYHCYLHPKAKIPFSTYIPLGSYIYLDEHTILKKRTCLPMKTFL